MRSVFRNATGWGGNGLSGQSLGCTGAGVVVPLLGRGNFPLAPLQFLWLDDNKIDTRQISRRKKKTHFNSWAWRSHRNESSQLLYFLDKETVNL